MSSGGAAHPEDSFAEELGDDNCQSAIPPAMAGGRLPINSRGDVRREGIGGWGFLFEQGLPRFRGRFSVNTGEAAGEIEWIFEAASVSDFLDREAGASEQGHGELELEEAKCLHGRVPQGGLK